MPQSSFTRGYAITVVSAAVLSSTGVLIRHLTQYYGLPALVLSFWRDVFASLTLLLVLGLLRPRLLAIKRHHWPYLAAYGLLLALFNSLWTLSVSFNGASVATVLTYGSAAFSAILGWRLLKESLGVPKLLAIGLCLSGCALVSGALEPGAWAGNVLGIWTGILSGLGYSLYSLMGRSAAQRGIDPWSTVLYVFGSASVFLLLFNLLFGGLLPGGARSPADLLWLGKAWAGWGILVLLAAGPTVVGYGLYNVSLNYLPSSVANLLLTVEPVFTAILAYFLLAERLNGKQIGGGLMILVGVLLLRIYEGRVARQTEFQASAGA